MGGTGSERRGSRAAILRTCTKMPLTASQLIPTRLGYSLLFGSWPPRARAPAARWVMYIKRSVLLHLKKIEICASSIPFLAPPPSSEQPTDEAAATDALDFTTLDLGVQLQELVVVDATASVDVCEHEGPFKIAPPWRGVAQLNHDCSETRFAQDAFSGLPTIERGLEGLQVLPREGVVDELVPVTQAIHLAFLDLAVEKLELFTIDATTLIYICHHEGMLEVLHTRTIESEASWVEFEIPRAWFTFQEITQLLEFAVTISMA